MPEDLPEPKVIPHSRNYKHRTCPRCGYSAYRLRTVTRLLHDLGDIISRLDLVIWLSPILKHRCPKCNCYFNADMSDLAFPKARYTHRVVGMAVRLVVEDGLPYRTASRHLWRDSRVFVPWGMRSRTGPKTSGKKSEASIRTEYINTAADELYDGPFFVLFIVDNHTLGATDAPLVL